MKALNVKVALITGAEQGIGATMARHMADQGAKVVITDVLDTSKAVDSVKGSADEALGLKVDVTSNEDLAAMVETAKSTFGGVDILVNNAGIFAALKPKPFHMIDEDEFDRVMRVNVRGIHQATRAVVPAMVEHGGGKIVNIASGIFYYGGPGLSHYTASKGAVIGLTRAHGRELGDKNIQVNAIEPDLAESEGVIKNPGFDPAKAPTIASRSIKRAMLPEDLLGALLFLATSGSDFVTGQTLNVDGGRFNT